MLFQPGLLDHLLADAIGGDDGIVAELRALFLASATGHVAVLSQAADPGQWREEALKLEGLAASFGMTLLMQAAARAVRSGPDQAMLDAVADALAACR